MDENEFAAKISSDAPWWAKAPIWLAAGVVGVPSMIAIGAGWFIAGAVSAKLTQLINTDTVKLQKLQTLQQDHQEIHREFQTVQEFMRAVLRAAQQNCLHTSKTEAERNKCVQVPDP
jgi:hypothetical protein